MIGQGIPQGLTRTPTASFQGVRAREAQPCRCPPTWISEVDLRRSNLSLVGRGRICLWRGLSRHGETDRKIPDYPAADTRPSFVFHGRGEQYY